jgi:hypothetical protein
MSDFLSYAMHQRAERGVSEFGRRALSPDRWQLLVDNFGRDLFADAGELRVTVLAALEIEGITFLPAVYYPA